MPPPGCAGPFQRREQVSGPGIHRRPATGASHHQPWTSCRRPATPHRWRPSRTSRCCHWPSTFPRSPRRCNRRGCRTSRYRCRRRGTRSPSPSPAGRCWSRHRSGRPPRPLRRQPEAGTDHRHHPAAHDELLCRPHRPGRRSRNRLDGVGAGSAGDRIVLGCRAGLDQALPRKGATPGRTAHRPQRRELGRRSGRPGFGSGSGGGRGYRRSRATAIGEAVNTDE
jgi:hypothetical protein